MPDTNAGTQTVLHTLGPQACYESYLVKGYFMLQRSSSTGEFAFYPRLNTASGATDLEWVEAAGTGTIHAITINRARGGDYNIALIELDEGVRMMSTLPDVETAPVGARVRARIDTEAETPRVVFDLLDGDAA